MAHAAFYRHLGDGKGRNCPGKYQSQENLDSTFDFGSSSSDTGLDSDGQLTHEDLDEYIDESEVQSESSSDIDLSEDEELWETSDEEISDGSGNY